MIKETKIDSLTNFAGILSWIFSPLVLIPISYAVLMLINNIEGKHFVVIFTLIIFVTVIIPLILLLFMKARGETSSIDIPEREKRFKPFLVCSICYLFLFFILIELKIPRQVIILTWAYFFNIIIASIITRFWKISIHGMSAGSPLAAIAQTISPIFNFGWVLLPILLFARVKVKAHTPMQVICGFGLGFILTFIQFKIIGV